MTLPSRLRRTVGVLASLKAASTSDEGRAAAAQAARAALITTLNSTSARACA